MFGVPSVRVLLARAAAFLLLALLAVAGSSRRDGPVLSILTSPLSVHVSDLFVAAAAVLALRRP